MDALERNHIDSRSKRAQHARQPVVKEARQSRPRTRATSSARARWSASTAAAPFRAARAPISAATWRADMCAGLPSRLEPVHRRTPAAPTHSAAARGTPTPSSPCSSKLPAAARSHGQPSPRPDATGESPPSPPPSTPHDRSRSGSGFTRNQRLSLQPEATHAYKHVPTAPRSSARGIRCLREVQSRSFLKQLRSPLLQPNDM
ncbi:hypothetical protein ACVWWN_000411 [Mycobacterium sp. URHB0021]